MVGMKVAWIALKVAWKGETAEAMWTGVKAASKEGTTEWIEATLASTGGIIAWIVTMETHPWQLWTSVVIDKAAEEQWGPQTVEEECGGQATGVQWTTMALTLIGVVPDPGTGTGIETPLVWLSHQ